MILLISIGRVSAQATGEFKTIMDNIYEVNRLSNTVSSVNSSTPGLLSTIRPDGSWADVDYKNEVDNSKWGPGLHFTRMNTLARAYAFPGSNYQGDPAVRQAVINTMNYWLSLDPAPTSTGWFYYTITLPRDIGTALITMRYGPEPLPATLESQMIPWMKKGKDIFTGPANTGSNLTDVAQHYIMRAVLTQDGNLLKTGVGEVGKDLVVTDGEGIKVDYSYTAHGPQLYIYGYGREFVLGVANTAAFVVGTSYSFTQQQMTTFTNMVRRSFIKASWGKYGDFNVFNRGLTRPGTGQADAATIEKVKRIDPANAAEYDAAIARIRGTQPVSYMINPEHTHFWRTDYTIHQRPSYMFSVRSVSTRTAKAEYGSLENKKGYYITEGVNFIAVDGDEYYNIPQVWDWNKLPGITVPEITSYPIRAEWGVNLGTVNFVGGASDGVYGTSTYNMSDYNTTARKGWFFFDDEVVCLGAGISSTAAEAINTTLNQTYLKGPVTVSAAGSQADVAAGSNLTYASSPSWVHHNNVGYYFPTPTTNVRLSTMAQTGDWSEINGNYSGTATKDIFKLWINHGVKPSATTTTYTYVVLPGKSAGEMAAYNGSHIAVLANSATAQVVRNSKLNMWQAIFYSAGSVTAEGITLKVNRPCVLLIKNISQAAVMVVAADPAQTARDLQVGVQTAALTALKAVTLTLPQGDMAGSSIMGTITPSSPSYVDATEVPPAAPITVLDVADSYVVDGPSANNNYGTSTALFLKNDNVGYRREAFLKFDLSNVPAKIDSAVIRVRQNSAGTGTLAGGTTWAFYNVADNTWTETGITWANRPTSDATMLGEVSPTPTNGTFLMLNITPAVRNAVAAGSKFLSIRVVSTVYGSSLDGSISSKENGTVANRPLIMVYPSSSQVAPPDVVVVPPAGGCSSVTLSDGQLLGRFLDRNVYVRVINGCWFASLSPGGEPVHVDWVKGVAETGGFAAGMKPFSRAVAEQCFKSNLAECMASWPTDCNQVQFTDGQLLGSFLDRNVYVRVINGCWFGSLSPTGQPVHVDWVKGVADRAGFAAGTQPFTRMLAEKCFKSNMSECGMAMSLREVAAELGGGLVLVPNPAGEQVQVQVPAGQEVRQVRIYSLSGTEVRRAAGGRVSLAGLAAGVYEVRVQTSGGRHYSGRLVKAGLGAH